MKYFLCAVLSVCITASGFSQYTVTLNVNIPGAYTGEPVYVAGDINGWNPASENYKLQLKGKNMAVTSFRVEQARPIEFKMTRGSWEKVETTAKGGNIQNRYYKIESDTTLTITVEGWRDWFPEDVVIKRSTASKNVQVLDTAFNIPQLKTKRAVRIYLPPGYAASKQKYPVLYMHDGQNLFDETLNPYGEWGVDEYLDSAAKTCIIVGIDHGGKTRMNEYNPYNNERFGKGTGAAYAEFLVKTLKPFIDKHFRTKKDVQHTFVAGSSMGGLISFYAALKYPKVFGKAGVISPAFWINYKDVMNEIAKAKKRSGQQYFIYAGQLESENLLQEVIGVFNEFNQTLTGNPVRLSFKALGRHNEESWRKLLPEFFEWLLR